MFGSKRNRSMGALSVLATAATLALAYGAPAGAFGANPCPGQYELRGTAEGEQSVQYDLNGNGRICAYVGSKTDVAPFKDDRVK